MKPALSRFFDSMAHLFEDRRGALDRVYAAHPGWSAPRARVAMYGVFVRHHVRDVVSRLFPRCRAHLEAGQWDDLVRAYTATRPARDRFAPSAMGEAFPSFLAERRELPAWLSALARFEWAEYAVSVSTAPVPEEVDRLTVNPTLEVLELPYRICAHARSRAAGAPERGAETALLWRHPARLTTSYVAASEPVLLVLKMAVEGLSVDDVAAATGLAAGDLRAIVSSWVTEGLVLAPRESPPSR
jgi:hypothetical protein